MNDVTVKENNLKTVADRIAGLLLILAGLIFFLAITVMYSYHKGNCDYSDAKQTTFLSPGGGHAGIFLVCRPPLTE